MTLDYLHNDQVTPEIGKYAQEVLKLHSKEPWGTCYYRDFDAETLVFRLEMHYHEPGGAAKPWGKHTGVSVLHLVEDAAPATVRSGAFYYGKLSKSRLVGVDPRLVATFELAIQISTVDITIVEGLRSKVKQAAAVKSGASFTMNSRHLTGHAVDAAPFINGAISWKWEHFRALAPFILEAAKQLKCPIEWGGNWPSVKGKSIPDGPHWQIPWRT